MTKEKLMEMGLTEEQANKVMGGLNGSFVEKTRFDEANGELKTAKATIAERDKQLETLKASTGDVESMKQKINELQTANAEKDKTHAAEIAKIKLDTAVDQALTSAKAKNAIATKAVLKEFLEKAELAEDGKVKGLDDEIKKLTEREDTKFLFNLDTNANPTISGASPAGTVTTPPDPKRQGFETRLAEARKTGNTIAAIQIKQEAAADGVVLI